MRQKPAIRSITATVVALGLLGTFSASAQAPAFEPARRVCEKDGGIFIEGGFAYRCQFSDVTPYRVQPARAICEHTYRGTFMGEDDNYLCLLPG